MSNNELVVKTFKEIKTDIDKLIVISRVDYVFNETELKNTKNKILENLIALEFLFLNRD